MHNRERARAIVTLLTISLQRPYPFCTLQIAPLHSPCSLSPLLRAQLARSALTDPYGVETHAWLGAPGRPALMRYGWRMSRDPHTLPGRSALGKSRMITIRNMKKARSTCP